MRIRTEFSVSEQEPAAGFREKTKKSGPYKYTGEFSALLKDFSILRKTLLHEVTLYGPAVA